MSEEKETHFMKRAQRKACWEAKELNQIKKIYQRGKFISWVPVLKAFMKTSFNFLNYFGRGRKKEKIISKTV